MTDLVLEATDLVRVHSAADDVLARHTGHTAERVREDTDRALVLAGQAAVGHRAADRVPEPLALGSETSAALRR